jgi:hypothetical protein
MYINSALIHDKSKVLNTSIPKDYSNEEIAVIEKNEDYLKYSIVQLIQQLSCAKANLANVQDELDTLHEEGIRVPDDHLEVEKLNDSLNLQVAKLIKVNQELSRRANMTWLERLFS